MLISLRSNNNLEDPGPEIVSVQYKFCIVHIHEL